MKKEHKALALTVLMTVIVIAAINNVSALSPIKQQLNGDTGWF